VSIVSIACPHDPKRMAPRRPAAAAARRRPGVSRASWPCPGPPVAGSRASPGQLDSCAPAAPLVGAPGTWPRSCRACLDDAPSVSRIPRITSARNEDGRHSRFRVVVDPPPGVRAGTGCFIGSTGLVQLITVSLGSVAQKPGRGARLGGYNRLGSASPEAAALADIPECRVGLLMASLRSLSSIGQGRHVSDKSFGR